VRVGPEGYILSTIKKAEDSPAWIIRWYDTSGKDGVAQVTLPFTPKRAVITNFLEEDGAAVPIDKNTLRVATRGNAIVTIKVEP
jgi:alpha-mannosidase